MFTLLGSLLGFLSSALPDILKLIRDRSDKKHELAILDKQIEMQREGNANRLEEINIKADVAESMALYKEASVPSGVKWVEGLRASVRPVITYAFFMLFCTVKLTLLYTLIEDGGSFKYALLAIWDDESKALFAAIISFWFGSRNIAKVIQHIGK